MFDVDGFIDECKGAIGQSDAHKAVREIVQRTVAHPDDVLHGLGEPKRAGVETIYHGDDLTILNVLWGPRMTIHPHNHLMWAVTDDGIEVASMKQLVTKDASPLGVPVIHSVTNPLDKITAAIHVYGGDFFDTPRSEWDPDSLQEHPYDVEHTKRVFEESNRLLDA